MVTDLLISAYAMKMWKAFASFLTTRCAAAS
jgi:hypothetical protein